MLAAVMPLFAARALQPSWWQVLLAAAIGAALGRLADRATRGRRIATWAVAGAAAVIAAVPVVWMTRTGRQDAASASGFLVVASGNGRASLTWDDVNAIQTQIPLIERAVPYMHQAVQLVSEDQNWNAQVVGTTPDYYRLRGLTLAAGHSFNASESGKVVVLGETTAKQLYGAGKQPIGETVRIKNMPFEIIGVLAHQGMSPQGQDLDDVALVPIGVYASHIAYDDLKSQFGGVVLIAARLAEDTERVKTAVRTLLRDRHHLAAGVDDDFVIREAPAVR